MKLTNGSTSHLAIPSADPVDLGDYSLPLQDIMGREPAWLLRSGALVIAFVFSLVIGVACIVRYPDTIKGKVVINGINPAAAVIARQSGYLDEIKVKEKQIVQRGDILGFIRSKTATRPAIELRTQLEQITPLLLDETAVWQPPQFSQEANLGPLLPAYASFLARLREHSTLIADDFTVRSIASLQSQRQQKTAETALIQQQIASIKKESSILNDQHERMTRLFKTGAISDAELKAHQRQILDQDRTIATIEQTSHATSIMISEYDKQIAELQHKRREDLRRSLAALFEAHKTIATALEAWDNDYVLRAPVAGTVSFFDFWSASQYVSSGNSVFIVTPASSELVARLPLSAGPLGKVKPGQRVVMKLNDYPAKEYGSLQGIVQSISGAAQNGGQVVQISLPNPLLTNYGKVLPFKSEMAAEASIVTEDRSLLSRIFDQFHNLVTQRLQHDPSP